MSDNPIKVLSTFFITSQEPDRSLMFHAAKLAEHLGIDATAPYDEIETALYHLFKTYIVKREAEIADVFSGVNDRPVNP